jgi:hypothetical protein
MPDLTPIQRDLQQLDVDMRRLEAEYTLFFNHRRARPPWELRKKVESLIRRWDNSHIASTADRFRFNTLQARFATFS